MKFEAAIIGGGLAGITAGIQLEKEGLKTVVISSGRSLREPDYNTYRRSGGLLLMGDTVTGGSFDGDMLHSITTENLSPVSIEADYFIIATGKYASGGLICEKERVREGILDLETVYAKDRGEWFNEEFYADQPFMNFGIKTDSDRHPIKYNTAIENLYACGEILEGIDGSREDAEKRIMESAVEVAKKITERWKIKAI